MRRISQSGLWFAKPLTRKKSPDRSALELGLTTPPGLNCPFNRSQAAHAVPGRGGTCNVFCPAGQAQTGRMAESGFWGGKKGRKIKISIRSTVRTAVQVRVRGFLTLYQFGTGVLCRAGRGCNMRRGEACLRKWQFLLHSSSRLRRTRADLRSIIALAP